MSPAIRGFTVALGALLVAVSPALAASPAPSAPSAAQPTISAASDAIQGVVDGSVYSASMADVAAGSSARWWREYLSWREVEPIDAGGDPAKMNWARWDAKIGEYTKRGMRPVLNILNPPTWVMGGNPDCGPYPSDAALAKWLRFVRLAVTRYSAAPYNVTHFMLYNEPDTPPGVPEAAQGGCWANNPRAYGQLLNATYPVIKHINPNAVVIFGAMARENFIDQGGIYPRDFFDRVITEGQAGNSFDMVAFNSYFYYRQNWEAYGPNLIGKAQGVRGVLAKYGIKKPIVVAELGMLVGGAPPAWPDPGTDADMANFVGQALTSALVDHGRPDGDGIAIALWFTLADTGDASWEGADFGLSTIKGVPKAGYRAYQAWSLMMAGATLIRNESEPTYGTVKAGTTGSICRANQPYLCDTLAHYAFETPAGSEINVLWVDSGNSSNNRTSATRQISFPASRIIAVKDQFGAPVVFSPIGDVVTISVGQQPMFVTLAPAASATVNAGAGGSLSGNTGQNQTTVTVPAGTFTQTVTLNMLASDSRPVGSNLNAIGGGFTLQALAGGGEQIITLQQPIAIGVTYRDSDLGATDERSLKLYAYDPSTETWQPQPTTVNVETNTATATVTSLTTYALIGQGYKVTVPAAVDAANTVK